MNAYRNNLLVQAGNLERVFVRDYQHQIAKKSDQQGQGKRKQLSLDFLC